MQGVKNSTVYHSQGSVWLRVKILSSQSCHLEFLYIFERKLAYLFILIGSLRSLIIFYIYLTEVVLFCKNSQAYLLCIYCLIKTGSEEGNVILLDQRLWKLKSLSTLAGILLIRGTMGYHIYIYFLSGYRGTPNSTAGHLSIFSARLSSTCSFLFPRNISIFA